MHDGTTTAAEGGAASAARDGGGDRAAAPRIVIYTSIVGGYDVLFPPRVRAPGVDYVLLSDRRPAAWRGWRWRPLPPETEGLSPGLANRWCKFFPQRLFPDADLSLYLDGSQRPIGDPAPLFEDMARSGAAIGLFPHAKRTSIREEAEVCARARRFSEEDRRRIEEQLDAYAAAGLPEDHRMSENAVLLRDHRHPDLDAAMALWWEEVVSRTGRDQISLPYVLHATGLPAHFWSWNYKEPNPYFRLHGHRPENRSPLGRLGYFLHVMREDGPPWGTLHRGFSALSSLGRGSSRG